MGMGGIDTDTIGHSRLGILGTNPTFVGKKVWQCDSCHTVPSLIITIGSFSNAINHLLLWHVSHNNLLTLLMHLWHQKMSKNNFWNLWHCDSCHSVTFYNEREKLFGLRNWCFHNSTWLFCDPCHTCRSIVRFATTDTWTKIIFGNVTLRQLSHCLIFENMESCFGFNIDALKIWNGYFVTHITLVSHLWHL